MENQTSKILISTKTSQSLNHCGEYAAPETHDDVWVGPNGFQIQNITVPQLGLDNVVALVWVVNDDLADLIVCYTKCGNKWNAKHFLMGCMLVK